MNLDVLHSNHSFHGTNGARLSCKFDFHWHATLCQVGPKANYKLNNFFPGLFSSLFFHVSNAKSPSVSKLTNESCPPPNLYKITFIFPYQWTPFMKIWIAKNCSECKNTEVCSGFSVNILQEKNLNKLFGQPNIYKYKWLNKPSSWLFSF